MQGLFLLIPEAPVHMSYIGVPKKLAEFMGNTCAGVSFNKGAGLRSSTLLKRPSTTGVFL